MDNNLKAKLERIIERDSDILCEFCKYKSDCPKGVKCYGGEPSFPPCSDGNIDDYVDWDSVEEYEEEIEVPNE